MPALENSRHEKFALAVARGASATDAAREVYGAEGQTACSNGWRLLRRPDIAARVAELKQQTEKQTVLSLSKKRELLAQWATADLSRPHAELLPIAQSCKYDGETGRLTEIKLPGKLESVQLDARLNGELDPEYGRGATVVVNVLLQRMLLEPADILELPEE